MSQNYSFSALVDKTLRNTYHVNRILCKTSRFTSIVANCFQSKHWLLQRAMKKLKDPESCFSSSSPFLFLTSFPVVMKKAQDKKKSLEMELYWIPALYYSVLMGKLNLL